MVAVDVLGDYSIVFYGFVSMITLLTFAANYISVVYCYLVLGCNWVLRDKVFFSVLLVVFLAVLIFYVVTIIYGNVVGSGVKVCIVDSSTGSIGEDCGIMVYNLTSLSGELVSSQVKSLSGDSAALLSYEVAVDVLGNSSCVIAFPEPRYVLVSRNVSVVLDDVSEEGIEDVIGVLVNLLIALLNSMF